MSRAQKNVRLRSPGSPKPEGGMAKGEPADVTKKNGATNVAGDVNRFTTDDYMGMVRTYENRPNP
jgi:hypothetical protein